MSVTNPRPKQKKRNTYTVSARVSVAPDRPTKISKANKPDTQGQIFHRIRTVMGWLIALLVGVCFLALVIIALFYGYRAITTSSFFAIERIDIRGAHHFNREQLLALAKIEIGMNSLQVSITEVEKRLRDNPWIAEVSIKRRLPNRFEIRVKEWQPHFWLTKDGQLFYANIYGNIIAPVNTDNFLSLPTLEIARGGKEFMSILPEVIAAFKSAPLPVEMQAVSWVKLSAARGFEFFLEKQGLIICIAPDNWEANLKRLTHTIQDLAKRGELREVASIWASDSKVWAVKGKK